MAEGLAQGLRVVDLSRVLAGPYAAAVLAEMGADVVKIEPPSGDPARGIGPHTGGRSLYFSALNTGKRGIVLDLASAEGGAVLDALLARADLVIENFRPDAGRALRCDPPSLLSRHPHLVVVSVTGFASGSARAGEPAFDLTVQAEAGIMGVTGEPAGAPVRAGVPIGDLAAGLWAALAAMAGYAARLRDGRGRHIEVPLHHATLALLSYVATAAAWHDTNPEKVGSGHHSLVPYGAWPTADGWIAIAVLGDTFWSRLCTALALPADLAAREDLQLAPGRLHARDTIEAAVGAALGVLTTADALAALRAAGVPCAPIRGVLDALRTPEAATAVVTVDSPEGPYTVVQGPLRIATPPRPAPALGEHTAEILAELRAPPRPPQA